tara:strand:+ start:1023 stop:1397 length:375 start_codon:yes stop_codon:yes gene_type:complete
MATVQIVTEDNMISVGGDGRVGEYTFPSNLWAIQWDGSTGHAEWTDGPNTVIEAADVAGYITAWEANAPDDVTEEQLTEQEVINYDSMAYLASTDWYASRKADTGEAIPSDIAALRAAAREAIV